MEKRGRTSTTTTFSRPQKRIKSAEGIGGNFKNQEVKLQDTPLFFPNGFENVFLAIYFVSLPYILGLLFQFFYIAEGKFKIFLAVNKESPFLLIWAIGYEILAVLIILWIIKSAISFTHENTRNKNLDRLR